MIFRRKEGYMRAPPAMAVFLMVVGMITANPSLAGEITISEEPVRNELVFPDLLIVRPLGAAVASITTALFVLSLPATYPLSKDYVALDLVERPWWFVSDRPLGVFQTEDRARVLSEEIDRQYPEILKRTFADGPLRDIR
jgi:hypothetical protein